MTGAAVTHRGTDIVAVSVVVGVVVVVVVVIVVDGLWTVRTVRTMRMIPRIVVSVMWSVPAPTVVETIVVPVRIVPVRTIVVSRPPPVVTQVDADAPAGRTVVVPIQVGEVWVVIAPASVHVGVEAADTRSIAVVIVVVGIIR